MKRLAIVAMRLVLIVGSAHAQGSGPEEGPPPKPAHPAWTKRLFYGGGLGLSFGSVESVYVAPLVGFHVVPHLDLGVQPFYLWSKSTLYTPTVETNDYGVDLLARARVFRGFFVEGRY